MELIVAGFHRSGTSLLAQLLHSAGLFIGDELLGAMPSKVDGHFEDQEILALHREILADNGTSWQMDELLQPLFIGKLQWERMQAYITRRQLKYDTWGFNEPQVCLFLGAWKFLLPAAKFLIVYRDPTECVRAMESMQAKDYFLRGAEASHLRFFREPDHGLKVWDVYNRAVLAFARVHLDDCIVIPYSNLHAGYPVIRAVNVRFSMQLRELPTGAVFDTCLTGHRETPQPVNNPMVEHRVTGTWHALENLAARTEALT